MAYAGRIPHGVGDRRGGAHVPDLAEALDPARVVRVRVVHPVRLDHRDVGVRGDVIAGEVRTDQATRGPVHGRLLVQSHREAPGHAADQLAACGERVDDPAGREDARPGTRSP
jgi:hypothetical protein